MQYNHANHVQQVVLFHGSKVCSMQSTCTNAMTPRVSLPCGSKKNQLLNKMKKLVRVAPNQEERQQAGRLTASPEHLGRPNRRTPDVCPPLPTVSLTARQAGRQDGGRGPAQPVTKNCFGSRRPGVRACAKAAQHAATLGLGGGGPRKAIIATNPKLVMRAVQASSHHPPSAADLKCIRTKSNGGPITAL